MRGWFRPRKTHCTKGHPYRVTDKGERICRECQNASRRERKAKITNARIANGEMVKGRTWNEFNYMPIPEAGCWIWMGGVMQSGYGKVDNCAATKSTPAHRYFYELHVGPIPAGLFVLHKCDTRLCVNPDHLFLGTHRDNMRDMVQKGRSSNKWLKQQREQRHAQ